jgi:hypothetical protein
MLALTEIRRLEQIIEYTPSGSQGAIGLSWRAKGISANGPEVVHLPLVLSLVIALSGMHLSLHSCWEKRSKLAAATNSVGSGKAARRRSKIT